jgi:ribosomal protein L30E
VARSDICDYANVMIEQQVITITATKFELGKFSGIKFVVEVLDRMGCVLIGFAFVGSVSIVGFVMDSPID